MHRTTRGEDTDFCFPDVERRNESQVTQTQEWNEYQISVCFPAASFEP